MRHPGTESDARFFIRSDRRNGIDRLQMFGAVDRSNVLVLEGELNAFAHAEGVLILDLCGLTAIDRWGLRTLERAAERAHRGALRLAIVNAEAGVRTTFEAAGLGHLLSGRGVSGFIESGHGPWSPIPLPSLLGQRASAHLRVAEEGP